MIQCMFCIVTLTCIVLQSLVVSAEPVDNSQHYVQVRTDVTRVG